MSNLIKRDIDPEFAAEFEAADSMRRESSPSPNTSDNRREATATGGSPEEDPLLAFKAIAERQQREGLNRKQFQDGSFDQIENDLTNTIKIGWDFLTRP